QKWPVLLLGGLVLALPAVIKLIPLLPVAFLMLQRWSAALLAKHRPRPTAQATALSAGCTLGVFLFLLAIPAACVGWRKNVDYLNTWASHVVANPNVGRESNFDVHSPRNQSLSNAVHLWTAAPAE